jgi:SAM-dependent methyltransferase
MLNVARTRLPGRLAAGDAQRLPVRTGSVAGLCLIHVLHLVGDLAATLAECARVLRPGGSMVTTALPDGVHDDLRDELARIRVELGSTVRQDEESTIVRAAADAGFALVAREDQEGRRATPRFTAELMEARSLSWMWAVDDDLWARALPAALARLRALPDQDRVRPGPGTTILAFHHP